MQSKLLSNTLFEKNEKRFSDIEKKSKTLAGAFWGNGIIGENILTVIEHFANDNEIPLEILSYPFDDDELWAVTLKKRGTIFVCINTSLPVNKQVFAAAHELYHLLRYSQNIHDSETEMASLLDSKTAVEGARNQEDVEANAFAGLLLMPSALLCDHMERAGMKFKKDLGVDDILVLMDLFGMPYKAIVLRLYECGHISKGKATTLLDVSAEYVDSRSNVTGKAKRWTSRGRGVVTFGSLRENMEINKEYDFLMESRIEQDERFIQTVLAVGN